jgi:hypothetical protein
MSSFRRQLREFIQSLADEAGLHPRADLPSRATQSKAIQLLKQHLTPEQREQYEKHDYFSVTGSNSRRLYRIRHGVQMNVEQLDQSGKRIRMLCFMPEGGLAVGDVMLAQKFALELYEMEALNIAHAMPALEFFLR